jgi:DNA-binding NarL/FixJ family response regulator
MTALEELSLRERPHPEARSSASIDPGPARRRGQPTDQAERRAAKTSRPSSRSTRRNRLIPIVIIDKSHLFRAGLTHVLAGSRFRIAADCSLLCDLPGNVLHNRECLALIGLGNSEVSATLSRIASLKGQARGLRAIVLTEQFHPEELLAAIEAGADGYLIKGEISPEVLVQSLELALLGGVVIPQGLGSLLKGRIQLLDNVPTLPEAVLGCAEPQLADYAAQSNDLARLSNREQVILMQLTQGAPNKHIARELNIAEATVKVHVKSLLRKIRVNNRTQAAMWGIERFRKAPE